MNGPVVMAPAVVHLLASPIAARIWLGAPSRTEPPYSILGKLPKQIWLPAKSARTVDASESDQHCAELSS